MPESLPAIGLACNIAQTIDFALKVLFKGNAIQARPGAGTDGQHALKELANNLCRLSSKIQVSIPQRPIRNGAKDVSAVPVSRLIDLGKETRELAQSLITAIFQAHAKGNPNARQWSNTRDALMTVWKEREMKAFMKRLGTVRKEVDATLLLAMQSRVSQSTPTEKSSFRFSVVDYRTHPWEQWQNESFEAIYTNGWQAKNSHDVEAFSMHVDSLIASENEEYFRQEIFERLHFEEQDDRLQSISAPHEDSFEWIFDPWHQKQGHFMKWLGGTDGQGLFWLTGKPGCGKSTLMKYLFRNERVFPGLEDWSGHLPGISTGCFLWSCGTELQKTSVGVLRTLLYEVIQDMIYGPLDENPVLVKRLFSERWGRYASYGGGLHSFTLDELAIVFNRLVSNTTKKFWFMIDGLDELEDDPAMLLDFIIQATRRENVKICVSSCSTSVYRQAFDGRPYLDLDKWTTPSILSYVLFTFDHNDTMFSIPAEQSDGTEERAIITKIVDKAAGNFLWAILATEVVIQSTIAVDNIARIRARVEALPSDLQGLLFYIFDVLDSASFERVSRLLLLMDAHGYPKLLPICYALDADTKSSLAAETKRPKSLETLAMVENLRHLLRFKCKNLLTIFESVPFGEETPEVTDISYYKLNYAHRRVRDFALSPTMRERLERAAGSSAVFDPDQHWANSHLWTLKTLRPTTGSKRLWPALADCLESALHLEATTNLIQHTYLSEVGNTVAHHLTSLSSVAAHLPPCTVPIHSFLDLAVWLNLSGYVSIVAKTTDRKALKHALEYRREVRQRLGDGSERKWIGGRPVLREVYGWDVAGLEKMVEQQSKPVRFGSGKKGDAVAWV